MTHGAVSRHGCVRHGWRFEIKQETTMARCKSRPGLQTQDASETQAEREERIKLYSERIAAGRDWYTGELNLGLIVAQRNRRVQRSLFSDDTAVPADT